MLQKPRPTNGPILHIAPLQAVVEPIGFATARGDDADPRLDALRRGVTDVRLEVFVGEQDVPFVLEIDARDFEATTIHVLASGADGTPLGAGRLLLAPDHPGQVHLGRLAVRRSARGTGLGARLVAAIEEAALAHVAVLGAGATDVTVVLAAQEQALGFYQRCGYRVMTGRRYLDAGIWHQDMARTLRLPQDD
ncbi:GNAT family N-acetyltransferase [Actinomyces sp. MRS3W]|uniref:GNAT family N-acetyltransferase n=1 Tax=Actinomyces sp. MRS3W TaxID=2800796 RepID=UPI0028FD672D|nr:GNAT family N-acetyltransferase [Actinomyces sp. MRS3W]MDU0347895.1 GNAT family N-acetyltransferase [Actinomyces sp. MRS3W]